MRPGGSAYSSDDDRLLLASIRRSEHAAAVGNFPFAALLVDAAGRVVHEAENTVATERDATAHSEVNLVRAVTAILAPEQLATSTLYVSAEPCVMCAAAICWANIGRVVHSLSCEALARIVEGSGAPPVLAIPCRVVFSRSVHHIDVLGPHREEESRAVHEGFWRTQTLIARERHDRRPIDIEQDVRT
jgi:tRNA(Arg) A34 adenosine deaminase TadA